MQISNFFNKYYYNRANITKNDGFLVIIFYHFINIVSFLFNLILEFFKFFSICNVKKKNLSCIEKDKIIQIRYGYVIESWHVLWLILNLIILSQIIILNNKFPFWFSLLSFQSILFYIVFMRLADLLSAIFKVSFRLNKEFQRSLPRSYTLLVINFLEVAAILSTFHYLLGSNFKIIATDTSLPCSGPAFGDIYYFTLRNMLTIGGGELQINSCGNDICTLFHILRIIQPIFSVLIVTMAINQTLSHRSIEKPNNHSLNVNIPRFRRFNKKYRKRK